MSPGGWVDVIIHLLTHLYVMVYPLVRLLEPFGQATAEQLMSNGALGDRISMHLWREACVQRSGLCLPCHMWYTINCADLS